MEMRINKDSVYSFNSSSQRTYKPVDDIFSDIDHEFRFTVGNEVTDACFRFNDLVDVMNFQKAVEKFVRECAKE